MRNDLIVVKMIELIDRLQKFVGESDYEIFCENGMLVDDEKVYQVSGIISNWEEMFFGAPMPIIIRATFMPFRDIIISDGLITSYNILVGGGMKKIFKDIYLTAKKNHAATTKVKNAK